jgi:hypothetical protein
MPCNLAHTADFGKSENGFKYSAPVYLQSISWSPQGPLQIHDCFDWLAVIIGPGGDI